MLAELASFALILALILSAGQALALPLNRFSWTVPFRQAAPITALLVFFAFIALILLRIDSDFSVANVAQHSNLELPLLYKVAGAWGNHEGSMLLWALVVTGFGAILSVSRHPLTRMAGFVQAFLSAGVLGFILFTSNPFARIFPPPADGAMLNPLLQDMALSLHPPLLYLGYVGFSAVYSLAIAGLLAGRIDRGWASTAHPWIMGAWGALTLGIMLGSWWAYRELGWGGFWFWDPVENASLLPWLSGTALLHANAVLKKRGQLGGWVALLSIFTFGLSLIGTFLVRSGLITSVHSFASDPGRGLLILSYLALTLGGGLWIYGAKAAKLGPAAPLRPLSREGVIVINNLFVLTACATVLFGTLYPIFAEAFFVEKLSVGAPYFNATFLPMMAVPLFFAGLAPFIPWKKWRPRDTIRRTWPALAAAFAALLLVLAVVRTKAILGALGFALAGFLMVASAQWLAGGRWKKLSDWPVFLGHAGAALLILGISAAGLWAQQSENRLATGESLRIGAFTAGFTMLERYATPNYEAERAWLIIRKDGREIATLSPEHRRYKIRGSDTSEASIHVHPAYDLYAVAGETKDGKTALRLYLKPGISFLWLGALLIGAGGLISAFSHLRRRA